MRRTLLSVLAATLLIPAFATPSAAWDPKDQLISAAEAAAVPIYPEEILVLAQGADTFAAAPIRGYENRPAAAFAEGVDMAFAYFDLPGSSIPTGFFTLRGRAPESSIQVGEYEGAIDLVNADGEVVATLSATMNTSSITVPDPLPYPRPAITGAVQLEEDSGKVRRHAGDKRPLPERPRWIWKTEIIEFRCPNGTITRLEIITMIPNPEL